MLWSGSKPLTVVRANMWGFLLFAGVAWLAISWSVLRLEPSDIAQVAGPVVLFGALTEAVRALAGTSTWWLNAGMAVLFAATGAVLLANQDSSFTAPAALVGWYLIVRGAADVAVSMMTRETDRIWGLLMVVGVLEATLGFFAASPFARSIDLAVTVLGGLALARGVADLVAALRLREVGPVLTDLLELPPERAEGLAGYTAGRTDYDAAPAVRYGPRHRAAPELPSVTAAPLGMGLMVAAPVAAPETTTETATAATASAGGSFHDEVVRTTADLDAMLALAGVTGAGVAAGMAEHHDIPEVPDTPEGVESRSDTAELATVSEESRDR